MDVIFSEKSIQGASNLAMKASTIEGKQTLADDAEDELAALALYLGLARGVRETASYLYQLADHFAGLPEAATDSDPQWREWK